MKPDVTVVIPHIPGRRGSLEVAIASVEAQLMPCEILVEIDHDRGGAATTRNRALEAVETPWIAWLDDDDVLYPQHVLGLRTAADQTDADLVYPWFDLEHLGSIDNTKDPLVAPYDGVLANPFNKEFGPEQRRFLMGGGNFVPVTHLIRTSVAREVGGFPQPGSDEWPSPECEDWGYLQRLLRADAKFVHYGERTWMWRHHGYNTSGRADRWH